MNDDTISRKQAIDALRVAYWDDNIQSAKDDPCIVDAMTDWAIRQVKALPPEQHEQCTGYWYPVGMAEAVGGESAQWGSTIAYHKCSECDEQALRDDFEQEVLSEFCPHCGVKMVGVSE